MGIAENCRELRIFVEHPARNRILKAEDVADVAQPVDAPPRLGRRVPTLVRVENDLHPGRLLGDQSAPADHIVVEIALELDAVVAGVGKAGGQRFDLLQFAMARPGPDANFRLNLSAQQIHERQPVQLGEGIPNGAFEAVILAAMRDRQFLAS